MNANHVFKREWKLTKNKNRILDKFENKTKMKFRKRKKKKIEYISKVRNKPIHMILSMLYVQTDCTKKRKARRQHFQKKKKHNFIGKLGCLEFWIWILTYFKIKTLINLNYKRYSFYFPLLLTQHRVCVIEMPNINWHDWNEMKKRKKNEWNVTNCDKSWKIEKMNDSV